MTVPIWSTQLVTPSGGLRSDLWLPVHSSEYVTEVGNAIDTGNAAEVRRGAHTIKGSVAVFGAGPAREVSLVLENIGRDARLEEADPAYNDLERELDRLIPAIQRAVKGG